MQSELQIVTRGLHLTEDTKEIIHKKSADLDVLFPRITSCRLTLNGQENGHEGTFEVVAHLDLNVPSEELVVSRCHGPDVETAVNSAFRGARRLLKDYTSRLRK